MLDRAAKRDAAIPPKDGGFSLLLATRLPGASEETPEKLPF